MINAITSEPLDRFTPNRRHFVHCGITIKCKYVMIIIKVKMAASRLLLLLEFHYSKTTEAKHLKLCTGMPYCYTSICQET
jgi:hypothetical protein